MLQGVGPRTIQSLTLASEVIHGTPSRFSDPARYSFAHGGKSGKPFPVPTNVYDATISNLKKSVEQAKIGNTDKHKAIKKLTEIAQKAEKGFTPNENFDRLIKRERDDSYKYGGRSSKGKAKPTNNQLGLFD